MENTKVYRNLLVLFLMFASISDFAQEFKIYGNVIDTENGDRMSSVSITLISDNSYVIGRAQTDSKEEFKFDALEEGNYTLKFNFLVFYILPDIKQLL